MSSRSWDNYLVSRWTLAGAWALVAALATTLTWQIVSAADAQVSERPPLQVAAPLPAASEASTTTTRPSTTLESAATSTTVSTPTTSAPGSSTSAPGTTSPDWSSQTIPTVGGTVVISYRPGEVMLGSATPAAGFAVEVKKQGPPEVDVEFESASAKFRVRAKWSDGELSIETESDLG